MGSSTYGIDVSTINKISNEIKNVYKKISNLPNYRRG